MTVVAVDVLLVERPADALHHAALDLAFGVTGMDGHPHVLDGRVVQDLHLTGFHVHLHIDDVGGKRRTWLWGRDRGAGHHGG